VSAQHDPTSDRVVGNSGHESDGGEEEDAVDGHGEAADRQTGKRQIGESVDDGQSKSSAVSRSLVV